MSLLACHAHAPLTLQPFMLLLCSVCGKLVDNPFLGDLFVLHASSFGKPELLASKPPVHLLVEAAAAVVTSPNWVGGCTELSVADLSFAGFSHAC